MIFGLTVRILQIESRRLRLAARRVNPLFFEGLFDSFVQECLSYK